MGQDGAARKCESPAFARENRYLPRDRITSQFVGNRNLYGNPTETTSDGCVKGLHAPKKSPKTIVSKEC